MKKLFALLAVAAFFFAACGNKTTAPEQEAAQGTEQVIEQEEPVADIAAPVEGEENAETPAEEAPVEGEVQA